MNIGRWRARLQRALDGTEADDRQRARGARDDDVELGEPCRQVGEREGRRREARAELVGARSQRAVGDRDRARMARREVGRRELDHLARADEQHLGLAQVLEQLRGEAHRGRRHADRMAADLGRRCALPWRRRTSAGTSAAASFRAFRRCPPRAPPASSGRGSAARRAPSSRDRWRRETHGAPPMVLRARRHASAASPSAPRPFRPATRAPDRARSAARRRRPRCGCRSRRSRLPRPARGARETP